MSAGGLSLVLLLFLAGGALGFFLSYSPAPFGARLPRLPRELYTVEGVQTKDGSVLKRRMPLGLLEHFVPQPDGAVPLQNRFESLLAGYSLLLPPGGDVVEYPAESFNKDGVDCEITFKWDQPLLAIKVSLLQRDDKTSYVAYADRIVAQMQDREAAVIDKPAPYEVDDYPFQKFSYKRMNEKGTELAHFIYVGPFGRFVLVMDFMGVPQNFAGCKAQVEKSMRTFRPGYPREKTVTPADPGYRPPSASAQPSKAKPAD